jgi:hypothetical protein
MGLYSRIAGLLSGPVQWISSVVAPGFSQSAAVSGAGANLTIAPQAATTTGASGSVVVNVSAPASGTAEAGFVFERVGTKLGIWQPLIGNTTTYNALYGGSVTPSASNASYFWSIDSLFSSVNAGTQVSFQVGGTSQVTITSGFFTVANTAISQIVQLQSPTTGLPFRFSNSAVTLTSNAATLSVAQQQTPNLTVAAVTLTGAGLIDFGNVTGNFQVNILGVNAASFATFGLSFKNGTTTTALPSTALTNGGLVIVRCDPNAIAFCA